MCSALAVILPLRLRRPAIVWQLTDSQTAGHSASRPPPARSLWIKKVFTVPVENINRKACTADRMSKGRAIHWIQSCNII
jgi:hypothetical protein